MEKIGIRALKAHASALARAVKEQRARYVITQRGDPVAVLLPTEAVPSARDPDEVWARLEALGKEMARNWQSEKSAAAIPSEMRQ